MEPLSKRIAQVLTNQKQKQETRVEIKGNPIVKSLDNLYEAISDEDSSGALELVHKITAQLKLEEEVSFEVPEEKALEDSSDEVPAD